jgi:hypothetical protein
MISAVAGGTASKANIGAESAARPRRCQRISDFPCDGHAMGLARTMTFRTFQYNGSAIKRQAAPLAGLFLLARPMMIEASS